MLYSLLSVCLIYRVAFCCPCSACLACSVLPLFGGFPPVSCAVPVLLVFGCVSDNYTMSIYKVYLFSPCSCVSVLLLLYYCMAIRLNRIADYLPLLLCALCVPCSSVLVGCFPVRCACAYTHPYPQGPPPPLRSQSIHIITPHTSLPHPSSSFFIPTELNSTYFVLLY